MITQEQAQRDFETYKKLAQEAYGKGALLKALNCLEWAGRLAYHISLCYVDMEMEALCDKISRDFLGEFHVTENPSRYVFYDCFAFSMRGLTMQYLQGIMSLGADILFITTQPKDKIDKAVRQALQDYPLGELFEASGGSVLNQIERISDRIKSFGPARALLHMTPWDIVGNVVWRAFPSVERYQIDLTDHTFWLGIGCADYFLEFRNYGCNIAHTCRGIDKDRILLQPYYPILQEGVPFQGGLKERNGIKVFSGGTTYKVYGKDDAFFNMIRRVLDENPEATFYFAGAGSYRPIERFVKRNGLQRRWINLGFRNDIVGIMKQMDLYIGTYPMSGGLMTQLAAACAVPVIAFDDGFPNNYLEELFAKVDQLPRITYDDKEMFHKVVNELLQNKFEAKALGKKLEGSLVTKEEFDRSFKILLDTRKNIGNPETKPLDPNKLRQLYFETENKYLHAYPRILLTKMFFRKCPWRFISAAVSYVLHADIKRLWGKLICEGMIYKVLHTQHQNDFKTENNG